MITEQIRELLRTALRSLGAEGVLPAPPERIEVERPRVSEHGDFSANVALTMARAAGMSPRELADRIVGALAEPSWLAKVEVAGPGFINFFLSHGWLHDAIGQIAAEGDAYGRSSAGSGDRIQVEFGSPNPTGPIHIGNARNIAYGDILAGVLEASGYTVERENYVNDAGGQIDVFGRSLEARYLQALGRDAEFPEEGYAGAYVSDLGRELAGEVGERLVGKIDEIREWGLARMLDGQRATFERFGVRYDRWAFERDLHTSGAVAAAIEQLTAAGHTYEEEGAIWFRAEAFGAPKDRVLIRSAGNRKPTYLAADAGYLLDKLARGFDHLVYLWGADHHGTAASLMAVARALQADDHVEIILYQFVSFTGGRMSKRAGEIVTLDELIDEVGVDAARFTFLTRSPDSSIDFDFDLVKAQSQENPVYYVQYAHARICSIVRKAAEQGIVLRPIEETSLGELVHESEYELMRKLAELPETVEVAAALRAPHRLTGYVLDLAALFHAFYRDCRVIGDDPALTQARLRLCDATRQAIGNVLGLLGVSAPESM
ncbi:MAG: arginine--tRNA ligase [Actinomycetota bacterium]